VISVFLKTCRWEYWKVPKAVHEVWKMTGNHPGEPMEEKPDILASEKARLRALSLAVIRSVVEQHHGYVENDVATDYIDIDVPDGEAVACAQEIGEQMGLICHHVYTQVNALFKGEVLIPTTGN
jgi:hypothetical protein